jgi:benzylsuccinate CoA-transferase BbsF subunit
MDPALDAGAGRVHALERLDRHIANWTRERDAEGVMYALQAAGVPAGVVQNGADLAERDPQLRASGFLHPVEEPHPRLGRTWADRLPLRFSATPCTTYRRARELGEDNAAVLRDWLGLPDEEVRRGERDGMLR